jgi:hypothetical protein
MFVSLVRTPPLRIKIPNESGMSLVLRLVLAGHDLGTVSVDCCEFKTTKEKVMSPSIVDGILDGDECMPVTPIEVLSRVSRTFLLSTFCRDIASAVPIFFEVEMATLIAASAILPCN